MDYIKYLNMENAEIPPDIVTALAAPGANTPLVFEEKNKLLSVPELQKETGFVKMENGNYLISMCVEMPGVTADMANWWFWWHPLEADRYKLWYPGEHFDISYAKKDAPYFQQKKMPEFRQNTQYPVERIGGLKMPLSISFVTPEEFGYDKTLMEENNVATIICGHVGALKGRIQHTEMSHIFFQREDGLFMVSRFWMGKRAKNPLVRKAMLTDASAKGMAEHCYVEYTNFARKVPGLYKEYLKEVAR